VAILILCGANGHAARAAVLDHSRLTVRAGIDTSRAFSICYEECVDGTCTERRTGRLDLRLINDVILRFDYVAWATN
jgi:hypothetical protein